MYIVLIPAYQPDETLVALVERLLSIIADRPNPKVIIVDDGSTTDPSKSAFDRLAKLPEVCLLRHAQNLGKGAALKTGFGYVLESLPTVNVVVTADADGQHLPADIVAVGDKALAENRPILVILPP